MLADECKDKKREENKKERKCPCGHAIVGGSDFCREQCSNGMYMRKSDMDTVLFGAQKSSGSSSHVNSVRVGIRIVETLGFFFCCAVLKEHDRGPIHVPRNSLGQPKPCSVDCRL